MKFSIALILVVFATFGISPFAYSQSKNKPSGNKSIKSEEYGILIVGDTSDSNFIKLRDILTEIRGTGAFYKIPDFAYKLFSVNFANEKNVSMLRSLNFAFTGKLPVLILAKIKTNGTPKKIIYSESVGNLAEFDSQKIRDIVFFKAILSDNKLWGQFINKDPDAVKLVDLNGKTYLHYAIEQGNDTITNSLIIKGADVNALSKDGQTPLLIAFVKGKKELVDLLMSKGANFEVKSGGITTPLHYAVENGNLEMVKFLMENGANPNLKNGEGKTPLTTSKIKGKMDIYRLLTSLEDFSSYFPMNIGDEWEYQSLSVRKSQESYTEYITKIVDYNGIKMPTREAQPTQYYDYQHTISKEIKMIVEGKSLINKADCNVFKTIVATKDEVFCTPDILHLNRVQNDEQISKDYYAISKNGIYDVGKNEYMWKFPLSIGQSWELSKIKDKKG